MTSSEHSRVFEQNLAELLDENSYELPDLTSLIRHDAKTIRSCSQVPTDDTYRIALSSRLLSRDTSFTLKRLLSIGKEDSRHKLYFGGLRSSGEERDVAVKEHLLPVAIGEVAMMQYASSKGLFVFDLDSIYVSRQTDAQRARERACWLLTHYRPGVESMDSVNWRDMDDVEKIRQVQLAALAVASAHINHIGHGDSYLRNVVEVPQDYNRRHLVDWESAVSFKYFSELADSVVSDCDSRDKAQDVVNRITRIDLRDLRNSVFAKVIPEMKSGAQGRWWKRNVMDLYIFGAEQAESHGAVLKRAGEEALRRFRAEDRA